jgi:hypothetical protein
LSSTVNFKIEKSSCIGDEKTGQCPGYIPEDSVA